MSEFMPGNEPSKVFEDPIKVSASELLEGNKNRQAVQGFFKDFVQNDEFRTRVQKIIDERFDSNESYSTRLEKQVKKTVQNVLTEEKLKAKNLWIPTIISISTCAVTAIISIISIVLSVK